MAKLEKLSKLEEDMLVIAISSQEPTNVKDIAEWTHISVAHALHILDKLSKGLRISRNTKNEIIVGIDHDVFKD